jgi:hypothetical protein
MVFSRTAQLSLRLGTAEAIPVRYSVLPTARTSIVACGQTESIPTPSSLPRYSKTVILHEPIS